MEKLKSGRFNLLFRLILFVFCFISAVLGVFFALGHFFARIQHEEKWKDYEECGII